MSSYIIKAVDGLGNPVPDVDIILEGLGGETTGDDGIAEIDISSQLRTRANLYLYRGPKMAEKYGKRSGRVQDLPDRVRGYYVHSAGTGSLTLDLLPDVETEVEV